VTSGTPWRAGRLGTAKGPQRLLFGQMHEDAEIERRAFEGKGRIFCIASAGDTAILLAQRHEVVACDINPVQLAYAEQRWLGVPRKTGDAERAMNVARSLMPLAGWRPGIIREFLALSNPDEQAAFWNEHLDTRLFRTGFDLLLSRPVLRFLYAPPFLSLLPPEFGEVVRKRLERGFARHANRSNPYARALLLGEPMDLQPFLNPPAAGRSLQFVLGDAASVLESFAPESFDGFTLSNILDGVDPAYRNRLEQAVRRAATKNAVIVMRSFAQPPPTLAANYANDERALLWGVVEIRTTGDP
jgi:hypothetical protein